MNDLEDSLVTARAVDRVELVGEYDLSRHDELLGAVLSSTTADVVNVDMSGVEFIDSSGLGALIRAQARLDLEGRRLRLVDLPDRVRRLVEMLELDVYLDA